MKPFDRDVWIVIFVMFLGSAAVFWFLEHDQVGSDIEGQDIWSQITVALFLSVTTFSGGSDDDAQVHGGAHQGCQLEHVVPAHNHGIHGKPRKVASSTSVAGISSMEDAVQKQAVICVWGNRDAADYEIVSDLYSTTPRNGNRVNGKHLDQSPSFSQKNGNSLTWVLVALPVCPTSPLRLRDSAEPRPNLELASGNCES